MSVEYVDHMGSDISIVNAARVSFGKSKDKFDEDDKRLLDYLVRHKHTSPFRHAVVTLRVTVPIFVERQWFKHQVGASANSISGRYVTYDLGFWEPDYFRAANPNVKQGSLSAQADKSDEALLLYQDTIDTMYKNYRRLIDDFGICKEQARAILPLATNTQFIFTATLLAWHHFYRLRSDEHSQKEIREYAVQVDKIISKIFPNAWVSLKEM